MTERVTILQEYVPSYRVPLFSAMRRIASERGIEVRVAAGDPHGFMSARADSNSDAVDIRIRQREVRILGKRLVLRQVARLYKSSDLVVVEQARRNLDVYGALLRWPAKIAMWGHGRDFTKDSSRFSLAVQRWLTERTTWFFGYTAESVDAVAEAGFPRSRTTTLWNSTDTRRLRQDLSDVSQVEINEFRGLANHVALFVGGLDESKKLDLLIEACDLVVERLPGFALVIGGAGTLEGKMRDASADRPWLRVVGSLRGHNLAVALRSADVMAIPGRVGLVAVDALTAGLPTVTTTWPLHGPERAYLDERNSVVSDQSAHSYAAALAELLGEPDRLRRLSQGCEEPASNLSIESMASRFVDGIELSLRPRANQ